MAQLHQTFDAAGQDIVSAVRSGYMTPAQGRKVLQVVAQQGMQAAQAKLGTLTGGQGVNKQMRDTVNQISSELTAMEQGLPSSVQAQRFGWQGVESGFLQPGTAGWYPGSVSQGATLAEQLISQATGEGLPGTAPSYTQAAPAGANALNQYLMAG
jgi:hypothetical protein